MSVEEYLATSYSPDVDYVEGRIEERHVGEKNHGKLIFRLAVLLSGLNGVFPFLETRVQVTPRRFRVPDLCVFLDSEPDEQIFITPPYLCIEVLSPEDRLSRTLTVAQDYLLMGVPHVWILDVEEKRAYIADSGGLIPVADRITAGERISLALSGIFDRF